MYTTLRTRGVGGGGGAAGAQRWLLLRNNHKQQVLLRGVNHHVSCLTAQRPLSVSGITLSRNQQKVTLSSSSSSSAVLPVVSSDESKSIDWRTNHGHSSKHHDRLNRNLHHLRLHPLGVRYYTTDNRDGTGGNKGGRNNNNEKSDSTNSSSNTTTSHPHRANFDRDVLQRAARGELDSTPGKNKHSSGIPRLAGRTHKANLRPPSAGERAGRLVAMSRAQDRHRVAPLDEAEDEDDEAATAVLGIGLDEEEEEEDDDDDEDNEESRRLSSRTATGSRGGGGRGPPSRQQQKPLDDLFEDDDYHAFELIDDNKYYWREEEQEKLVNASDEFDESLLYDEDGNFVVEYTEEDMEFKPLLEKSDRHTRLVQKRIGFLGDRVDDNNAGGGDDDDGSDDDDRRANDDADNWGLKQEDIDPEDRFFYDNNDIFEICQRDDEDVYDPIKTREEEEFYNMIMPLAPHEPGLDGFLQAMHEHPTKYATVTFENLHPGSKREPKPLFFKKTRHQPPVEWVESHKRFLYVTGLPPLTINGEPGNMSNAVHRSFLQQSIAKLVVGVDDYSTQVCVANRRSAFVGFASPRLLARALAAGPQEPYLKKVPMISLYQPSASPSAAAGDANDNKEEDAKFLDFTTTRPDCIVRLTNTPPGNTSGSVACNLFPPGTKVGEVYGTLTIDDVYFMTKTSILVRFASPEQAQSAVTSALVLKRLEEWGTYPVQFFRARRELVHAGFGEISKDEEVRVMGPRLIVDGDMPSRQFHISHAGTILLRNLDATETNMSSSSSWQTSLKKDLTALFQPFCERRRDGNRSIEFVTCQAGRFTGHAYIGFDEPDEAEACINECKGRLKFGDRTLGMKLVHDRIVPHQPAFKPEKRPARSEQELLDDLNNWEKYIDPADIEYLQKHGVSKLVIDEALRGIRRNNPTFGAFDAGLRSEALEPSMERGQQYKELVQMYVATLKECIATPDDVGEMYEALHFPDEPIDLSVFDKWNQRLKGIERVRSAS